MSAPQNVTAARRTVSVQDFSESFLNGVGFIVSCSYTDAEFVFLDHILWRSMHLIVIDGPPLHPALAIV